jgi:hypothetical protein
MGRIEFEVLNLGRKVFLGELILGRNDCNPSKGFDIGVGFGLV